MTRDQDEASGWLIFMCIFIHYFQMLLFCFARAASCQPAIHCSLFEVERQARSVRSRALRVEQSLRR